MRASRRRDRSSRGRTVSRLRRAVEKLSRVLPTGGAGGRGGEAGGLPPGVPGSLPGRHLENLRVLPDREALLERLPRGGVVAELGVAEGEFSRRIRAVARPATLYLVDMWATDRYDEGKMRRVEEKFAEEIASGEVRVVRKRSEEALADFPDGHLDWVYIDTSHQYEQTLQELELSRGKVGEGGTIAGHDYCVGNPSNALHYGVVPAVHRFCVEHGWEIVYLTLETDGHRSFALREM